MPIHPIGVRNHKGTLGSPYASRDFRGINPAYGTPTDFHALVHAVHERGMKVIIDWVPDHTAADHPWVREHPDYYVQDEHGKPSVPRGPDGKLTDWDDVLQLDYRNPAVRREMIASMRYWLEKFEIDGFRVDAAGFVSYDFWREAVPALRAAVPRPILLLAEWGDLEMHRVGYDLTYGWDSYKRLKAVWRGTAASTFVRDELADLPKMPPGGMRMRFTTNHDETAWDDPPLKLFGGSAGARAAYVAIALLPGRPLLYDGQEVESPQKLGLFERQPIVWNQPQASKARAFYASVVKLARTEPALVTRDLTRGNDQCARRCDLVSPARSGRPGQCQISSGSIRRLGCQPCRCPRSAVEPRGARRHGCASGVRRGRAEGAEAAVPGQLRRGQAGRVLSDLRAQLPGQQRRPHR